METVNIHQAKTNLSKLLSRVELGEEKSDRTESPQAIAHINKYL
jgi:antitoxin (DNA-binding transcriptional repressor) of toxin-antitoxin stability system